MAEFIQSLLGCEEHAKCFKEEVRNGKIRYIFVLLGPGVLCFHLFKCKQEQLDGGGKRKDHRRAQQCSLCWATLTFTVTRMLAALLRWLGRE